MVNYLTINFCSKQEGFFSFCTLKSSSFYSYTVQTEYHLEYIKSPPHPRIFLIEMHHAGLMDKQAM